MKLEKAIRKLQHSHDYLQSVLSTEDLDAIKLGIEALNFIIKLRTKPYFGIPIELPAETKE